MTLPVSVAQENNPIKTITVYYDGDCLFCRFAIHYRQLFVHHSIQTVNLRVEPHVVRYLFLRGIDVESGVVVKESGGTYYQGINAIQYLESLLRPYYHLNIWDKIRIFLWSVPLVGWLLYTFLLLLRKILLRFQGIPPLSTPPITQYIVSHGASYFIASLFFPLAMRRRVFLLYALVRIIDDIVDVPTQTYSRSAVRKKFTVCRDFVLFCYTYGEGRALEDVVNDSDSMILNAFYKHGALSDIAGSGIAGLVNQQFSAQEITIIIAAVMMFRLYAIPLSRLTSFLDAMESDIADDTHHVRVPTYDSLKLYMHGSAEVIGRMVVFLSDTQPSAPGDVWMPYAALLGEAMQYTNFLRDVALDYRTFNRIYLPLDRLTFFDLNHDTLIQLITEGTVSQQRLAFLKKEIILIRQHYTEARKGIALLPLSLRHAVGLSSYLYEAILDRIEALDYTVTARPARTTLFQKLHVVFRYFLSSIFSSHATK